MTNTHLKKEEDDGHMSKNNEKWQTYIGEQREMEDTC